ncbi:MAG TPA: aspartate kinase, partial [Candidatus Marinimicrobia bacterium]|nr:aspartate kinase [Candidatus Neomarinimicrobiota bacterium]
MDIVVQKYGGSSLADIPKIKYVSAKIKRHVSEGKKLVVIVSAMGKTTDQLELLCKEVSECPVPREKDMLFTTGEQVSAALMAMALNNIGVKALSQNAFQTEIITSSDHTRASIRKINAGKLKGNLKDYDVVIVTGFQGITESGDVTTLGRGGSDTSAVAIAAALGAPCEIYSDFPGIFTTDPKLFPAAKILEQVSYAEMLEMAQLGAGILHPRAVEIAKKYNVKLCCRGTFSNDNGSRVVSDNIEQPVVTGLSVMENQAQVTITGLPEDHIIVNGIFNYLGEKQFNIDMISAVRLGNNNMTLSFTIVENDKNCLLEVIQDLQKEFCACNIT